MVNRFLASGLRVVNSNQHTAAGDLWCDGVKIQGAMCLISGTLSTLLVGLLGALLLR